MGGMAADPTAVSWLISPRARTLPIQVALGELVEHLCEADLSLSRVGFSLPTLHPDIWAQRVMWTRAEGARVRLTDHDVPRSSTYLDSPVARIHAGSPAIRCRLVGPDADLSHAICRELAAEGATDYFCMPLELGNGRRSYFSLATDAAHGFDERALERVVALSLHLSLWLELRATQYATRGLLEVYLGKKAAARVLAGQVHRGTGSATHAAVWTCDLRGFTTMSDVLPAVEVVALLDRYFEAVAGPIIDHGGEVLKIIGDAVLAIFPVCDGSHEKACGRALLAAEHALAAMDALNRALLDEGKARLDIGLALHVGEVMFGNVGARERLDFTVIGAAVNEVCRMESLCKTLGTPLVVSEPFARSIDAKGLISLGKHALRGVAEPAPLYTLASHAPPQRHPR
jgi:adenylate cyclase